MGLFLKILTLSCFHFQLCSRHYTTDEHKLKHFPSTLKDSTLRWFMSLEGNNITTWDYMKNTLSESYQDYCRARDTRYGIFRMTQGLDESLEYFEDIFQLSYKRAQNFTMDNESLKLVLLIGFREDLMETLNLLSNGDIYQLGYNDIKIIFKNHSRSSRKEGRSSRGFTSQYSNLTTHINNELGGLIEEMKTHILQSLYIQMDTL